MPLMRLRVYVIYVALGWVLGLAAMTGLPHDKYLRYQQLNDGTAPTAYWIYERIHDDPTPIDIAFIGTSRTGMSIHSRRLEEDLARLGYPVKAANLHIVKNGTDMQYVVAKELLDARKVSVLVVELIDWEDRKTHPDFIYLADTKDVIEAPLFINLSYFSDLLRLPGRQIDLFLQTQEARLGWGAPSYVPPYEGPNLDHAEYIRTLDGVNHYRSEVHSLAEMQELRREQERLITPPLLPRSLEGTEFRMTRYYMNRILELASEHHTKVVFLYTPRFGGPAVPPAYALYANRVALINPAPVLGDWDLWADDTHVNWNGARRMTDFVAQALAAGGELRAPESAAGVGERGR